ncbi:MAG: hypothetical protein O9972_65960, partial [Burkholderiales bacterium]|nr:hypothetical protein [Burkholderiales bacterium]
MPLAPGGFPRLSGMPPDTAGGAVRLGLPLEAGKVRGPGVHGGRHALRAGLPGLRPHPARGQFRLPLPRLGAAALRAAA